MALTFWAVSAYAVTGPLVELRPTVQSVLTPFERYQEPFDALEDMIAYDSAPTSYYPTITEVGTMVAVRFTPAQPCSLKKVQIVSYNGAGPGMIHIWDDDGTGFPNADIVTPFQRTLQGNTSYQNINISPAINIGAVDFHAGWEYVQTPAPFFTTDGDGSTTYRSKIFYPGDSWYSMPGSNAGDLNIRAFVQYYGEDLVAPSIVHTAIDMGFSQGAPQVAKAIITDDSGIDNAYLYYRTSGNFTGIEMTNTSGNNYQVTLPQFEVGTVVDYYIQATDGSIYANTGYYPIGGESDPISYTVVEGMGIAYDDGGSEGWWIVDTTYSSNAFAVRCTPSTYPVKVTMLRAFVNGTNEFEFSINAYTGGFPGAVLAGPWRTSATTSQEWVNFEIPEGAQYEVNSGDFCVVFNWLQSTPADPGVAGDATAPDGRSFWRSGSWNADATNDFMLRAVVYDSSTTSVEELGGSMPNGFALEQNYPNPFNATTNISFSVDKTSNVNLSVYNLAGQLVETLVNDVREPGSYTINWNADNYSSGVYFYRLASGNDITYKKMNLLK